MPLIYRPLTGSLRSRLLVLTFVFVMIVELLIYLPSLATFRQTFLEQRVANAQTAALSLRAAPDAQVSPTLEQDLLESAGVIAIVLQIADQSLFLGFDAVPDAVDAVYDLRSPSLGELIGDALTTLRASGDRMIRVIGNPTRADTRLIELTLSEQALYGAMLRYSNNILLLSLLVSLFTGVLIYWALHQLVVRPMRVLTRRIVDFREHPEGVRPLLANIKRHDEIGVVARELSRMQDEVRQAMKQRAHLAELGEAVSKINHDLRNILTTAKLSSDALQRVDDPRVNKISQRLMSSVSRAVALCERTMKYGRSSEPEPEPKWIDFHRLVYDVAETLDVNRLPELDFVNKVPEDTQVYADDAQLHRVILNLCRNALEAQHNKGLIEISANQDTDKSLHILLRDAGPGIPEQALPNLFKAFNSSGRRGGTGLGLAISREIILAHGGQIGLETTGPEGTTFRICLPGPSAL